MNDSIKNILKYGFSFGLAILLIWIVFRDSDFSQMFEQIKDADLTWLYLSAFLACISHVSRGLRWCLTLNALGYFPKKTNAIAGVFVGYFVNLFLPRVGEVSRCGTLQKTDDIPLNVSFGAVMAERVIDLVMLGTFTLLTLLVEYQRIIDIINEILSGFMGRVSAINLPKILLIVSVVVAVSGGVAWYIHKKHSEHPLYQKITGFVKGFIQGIVSLKDLTPRGKLLFIFHTLLIWSMYYFMTYVLFFSFEKSTELGLGMSCALSVFVLGGVGMILTPGGTGAYHALVIATLSAYQAIDIPFNQTLTVYLHSSQTLIVIITGGISMLYVLFQKNRSTKVLRKNS